MNKVDFPVVNHIEIRDGQARIVGRNVKVKMIVSRLFDGTGASIEDVMEQYDLSRAEVMACLEYYYDHKDPSIAFSPLRTLNLPRERFCRASGRRACTSV